MSISDALGQLNYERNQEWQLPFTTDNARPAIYAFNGDVYRGLDAYTIPKEKIETSRYSAYSFGIVWVVKTFRFNSALPTRNGNKISSR